jgi:hypothetical protein
MSNDYIDFTKTYIMDEDVAPFEYVDGHPINVFSLLAERKKKLFNIDKPIQDIVEDDILDALIKAVDSITIDDYRAFMQDVKPYKTSLEYANDIIGYTNYLYTAAEQAGYYDLACILNERRHPKNTKAQRMNYASMFAITVFSICQKAASKNYKPNTYQHKPVDIYQQPNDKITKNLATATKEEMDSGQLIVNEKVGNIFSYITLYPEEAKRLGLEHINTFDLFVLFSCISIKAAGNGQTTVNIIYKTMTGKSGEVKIPDKMRQEIMQSIDKLRLTPITIDATGICAKYNHKAKGKYTKSYLLPAKMSGEGVINGGYTDDIITFYDDSPLYEIALMKNKQLFSINREIFDIPINANKQNLTLRQVLATLIYDACHSPKIGNTILIDTLMERSEWDGKRIRLVDVVEKCLDYWIEKRYLIMSYKIIKEKNKAVKIKFTPIKPD